MLNSIGNGFGRAFGRFLFYLLIGLLIYLIGSNWEVQADSIDMYHVSIDNYRLDQNNFGYFNQGNRNIKLVASSSVLESKYRNSKLNFIANFCVNFSEDIPTWYNAESKDNQLTLLNTGNKCASRGGGFLGKHVVVYGASPYLCYDYGNSETCSVGVSYIFYQPVNGSWSFLDGRFTDETLQITYPNGQVAILESQNNHIINQNDIIIRQNTDTYNSLNDSNPPSNNDVNSFLDELRDVIPSNGTISNLLLIPVDLMSKILSTFEGQCKPFKFKWFNIIRETEFVWECVNLSSLGLSNSLVQIIDFGLLIGLFYYFSQTIINMWNKLIHLEDEFEEEYTPAHAGGRQWKHFGGGK